MADFRKAKYSGSLNLAPECGPVNVEIDTDAKTVTPSLEPDSPYTVTGGGGLNYVIPEQTVTFSDGSANVLNINVSELSSPEPVLVKCVFDGQMPMYITALYQQPAGRDPAIVISETMGLINVRTGVWTAESLQTVTISAIKGF